MRDKWTNEALPFAQELLDAVSAYNLSGGKQIRELSSPWIDHWDRLHVALEKTVGFLSPELEVVTKNWCPDPLTGEFVKLVDEPNKSTNWRKLCLRNELIRHGGLRGGENNAFLMDRKEGNDSLIAATHDIVKIMKWEGICDGERYLACRSPIDLSGPARIRHNDPAVKDSDKTLSVVCSPSSTLPDVSHVQPMLQRAVVCLSRAAAAGNDPPNRFVGDAPTETDDDRDECPVTVCKEKRSISVGDCTYDHNIEPFWCDILQVLISAKGDWVSGPVIQDSLGLEKLRVSREIKSMKEQVPALENHVKSGGNKGFCFVW